MNHKAMNERERKKNVKSAHEIKFSLFNIIFFFFFSSKKNTTLSEREKYMQESEKKKFPMIFERKKKSEYGVPSHSLLFIYNITLSM